MATSAYSAQQLAEAIVAFALDGRFPEYEDISTLSLSHTDLIPAIKALDKAKAGLEAEIQAIDDDTKDDVEAWVQNAKALQDDITRSKKWANDMVRQSEAPAVSGEDIKVAQDRVEFIAREAQYIDQLCWVLGGIKDVEALLSGVERARDEKRIVEALRLLEQTWAAIDRIPVSKSCRIMRLLDIRSFELKSDVHEVFDKVWKELVHVDMESSRLAINTVQDGERITLEDAVVGLKAYKEVDERMEQLWHNLDATIVSPRMKRDVWALPRIHVEGNSLELVGESAESIAELLSDLETFLLFLSSRLPAGLLRPLSTAMMADLVPRLVHVWLDAEVPSSLSGMDRFQEVIATTGKFCTTLRARGFSNIEQLEEWVGNAPSVWLNKCRETALESVRTKLANGISGSREVERVERHLVSNEDDFDEHDAWDDDGQTQTIPQGDPGTTDRALTQITGASAKAGPQVDDDVDTAAWGWDDGGDGGDDGADAWGLDDEEDSKITISESHGKQDEPVGQAEPIQSRPEESQKAIPDDDDDDSSSAWDLDYDDGGQHPGREVTTGPKEGPLAQQQKLKRVRRAAAKADGTREIVLREAYMISSMPEPVLELIFALLEDGATLTQAGNETSPVAAVAAGLFGLPTLALALFRAVSPYYYSRHSGGNMYLYNDTTYLVERLSEFAAQWKARDSIGARARNMLRLDNEIKSLRGFANRSYTNELALQKTVLRDLLGGNYSLMQQDETESCIDSAVAHVRTTATAWESILARSVWAQATGSLLDAIAAKLTTDVMEMPSIGQDEAYNIAHLISMVTELDDLFLPSRLASSLSKPRGAAPSLDNGDGGLYDEVPSTPEYTRLWLRLKYLSEVLQSNLNEMRYLWFDGELSLYFTADEVVELVGLSFAESERSRGVVREIEANPEPKGIVITGDRQR